MPCRRLAPIPPPAVGGAVMATGIVSIGLQSDGRPVASAALAGVAVALWVALAVSTPALTVTAIGLLVTGLVVYGWVLVEFDWRQLLVGAGDHWVAGGALAISALAAHRLVDVTLDELLYILALAWLPVLVAAELVRPRLGFDQRRWATVFPLGMYAAAGFVVVPWTRTFASGWIWVAAGAWVVVAGGAIGRILVHAGTSARRWSGG
jgi:hypothetical protein